MLLFSFFSRLSRDIGSLTRRRRSGDGRLVGDPWCSPPRHGRPFTAPGPCLGIRTPSYTYC
jgi:hypothetical protein